MRRCYPSHCEHFESRPASTLSPPVVLLPDKYQQTAHAQVLTMQSNTPRVRDSCSTNVAQIRINACLRQSPCILQTTSIVHKLSLSLTTSRLRRPLHTPQAIFLSVPFSGILFRHHKLSFSQPCSATSSPNTASYLPLHPVLRHPLHTQQALLLIALSYDSPFALLHICCANIFAAAPTHLSTSTDRASESARH